METTLPQFVTDILSCPFCSLNLTQTEQGFHCGGCNETYPYKNRQPDFRLRRQKNVTVPFSVGENPFPEKNFDFNPLSMNQQPEVDYSNFEAPTRVSKEQMSYIPQAKSVDSLVLDLGCGEVFHREICEQAGYKYVGLDYDEPKAPLLGDGHALPFKDQSFDFILSIAVLEHVYNPFVVMREAFRVLKPGGKIVGTVAFLEPFHANSCYHHSHLGTYYTLNASGFNVQKVAPSKNWSVLIAQSGLLFSKMPRPLSKTIVYPVYMLHRLWWKTASRFSAKASERNRMLFTAGSFTFIATRPL